MLKAAKTAAESVIVAIPTKLSGMGRKSPIKVDYVKDIVYLYQFPRSRCIPNVSPFCLKLETWLRMAQIKYEVVPVPMTTRSKQGMLPFVEINGTEISDSGFIIRDLPKVLGKPDLDPNLTLREKAIGRCVEQMMENSALWSFIYLRNTEHADLFLSKEVLGYDLPKLMKLAFPSFIMSQLIKVRLYNHGIGRHSRDEIVNIGLEDLRAVSDILSDKKFLLGPKPSNADATLFGILAQIVYLPLNTPHKELIFEERKNLLRVISKLVG